MRTIPVISRKEFEKSSSGQAALCFVTITHPDTPDVIRLVMDGADYLMDDENGDEQTWHKSFFELDLVSDDENPPTARFRFPNVNRQAINLLRSVTNPPLVSFQLISSNYFDLPAEPRTAKPGMTIEPIYTARGLFLTDTTADPSQVEGTLRGFDYRQEQWPDMRVTQALLPGVFAR